MQFADLPFELRLRIFENAHRLARGRWFEKRRHHTRLTLRFPTLVLDADDTPDIFIYRRSRHRWVWDYVIRRSQYVFLDQYGRYPYGREINEPF